jgi:hypothetical protein
MPSLITVFQQPLLLGLGSNHEPFKVRGVTADLVRSQLNPPQLCGEVKDERPDLGCLRSQREWQNADHDLADNVGFGRVWDHATRDSMVLCEDLHQRRVARDNNCLHVRNLSAALPLAL